MIDFTESVIFFFFQADIEGRHLSIALEPEAASLYCQYVPTDKIHGSEGATFSVGKPGSKYMVIDLGGKDNTVCNKAVLSF